MMDFGYNIIKIKTVDLDRIDKSLYNRVVFVAPDINKCIACGSCSASCSVSFYNSNSSFRKALVAIERDDITGIKESLSSCVLCGKCSLVCPRGINTRGVIIAIKDLLKEEAL